MVLVLGVETVARMNKLVQEDDTEWFKRCMRLLLRGRPKWMVSLVNSHTQMYGFFSQLPYTNGWFLPYTCHLEEVASVGD